MALCPLPPLYPHGHQRRRRGVGVAGGSGFEEANLLPAFLELSLEVAEALQVSIAPALFGAQPSWTVSPVRADPGTFRRNSSERIRHSTPR